MTARTRAERPNQRQIRQLLRPIPLSRLPKRRWIQNAKLLLRQELMGLPHLWLLRLHRPIQNQPVERQVRWSRHWRGHLNRYRCRRVRYQMCTATCWMSQLAASLSALSISPDFEEYAWILETFKKSKMELGNPGPKFIKLDQLLQVAAVKQFPKERMWEYMNLAEEMAVRGRPVSGRQVIWIIWNAIESTKAVAYITSYENLEEILWYGDALYQVVECY